MLPCTILGSTLPTTFILKVTCLLRRLLDTAKSSLMRTLLLPLSQSVLQVVVEFMMGMSFTK